MSDQKDRDFERYLEGGDPVSRAYDPLRAEQPSADIDRRVLAAARAALEPKRGVFTRWPAYAALAATVILSVAVVLRVGVGTDGGLFVPADATGARIEDRVRDNEVTPDHPGPQYAMPEVQEEYAGQPQEALAKDAAEPDKAASPTAAAALRREEPTSGVGGGTRAKAVTEKVERSLRSRIPASPPPASAERERTLNRAERSLYDSTATAVSAPSASSAQAADADPEAWLERIEALRKGGEFEIAESELNRFRIRYPGYLESREAQPTK